MFPTRQRDRKKGSQSHAAAGSREKCDFSVEPCAIFLLHFQVASLGLRSQPHLVSRREVAMSAILPAIKYPLQARFHVSVIASKAPHVDLCDGIELATTRSVWKEPAVTMDDNFFDPPLSQLRILVVGQRTRTKARSFLLACESCDSDAEFPFDWVLDEVTGADPASTDYLIDELVSCPWCGAAIGEKTLVNWQPSEGT